MMARGTTTPQYKREHAALAWLNVPRTSTQIAELIGITPNHASALLRRLWVRGKVDRTRDQDCYRYTRLEAPHGEV